jgi:glutamate--cysteine ligase
MPTPSPTLDADAVAGLVGRALVPAGPVRGTVGLEAEWIVVDRAHPARPVGADEVLRAASGALPAGGGAGVEPGGQLELATRRHVDVAHALAAADEDEQALRRRLGRAGLAMVATGVDPWRPPRRTVDLPRYRAMEAAFDARGPAGRVMMCSTAALQVNLDFGADPAATCARAALVAPVLAAAFANSPRIAPDGSVLASARSLVWAAVDPGRTRPVPAAGWVDYALGADVLYVRVDGDALPVREPLPLTRWVTHGHASGYPTADDVTEHLTTLFPPVRPRGWLECRFLDALAADDRRVAVPVVAALVADDTPLVDLAAACAVPGDPWALVPAGAAHPGMRQAAEACLSLAAERLDADRPGSGAPVRAWAAARAAAGWAPPPIDLQSLDRVEQETP